MTTLEEKVNCIIEEASNDYNSLPFEDRKRIAKYMAYEKIRTLWQVTNQNLAFITPEWKRRQIILIENLVSAYLVNYEQEETDG